MDVSINLGINSFNFKDICVIFTYVLKNSHTKLHICVMCMRVKSGTYVWRSEDKFKEWFICSTMGSWDGAQV